MKSFRIAVYEEIHEDAIQISGYLKEILVEANIELYEDANKFIEEFRKIAAPFDLIFLAVSMVNRKAIEMAREVRDRDMFVPIIFVSESDKFYREAYDAFAFNYLLKPLDKKQMEHVLYPLRCRAVEKQEKNVTFRYRSQVITLKLSQIMYISSSLHTVNFNLKDGTCVHCRGKLNDFTEQLNGTDFLRCHQSFFINMQEITSMKTDSFGIGDHVIPISRSYAKQSQQKYKEFLIKKGKNKKI